MRPMIVWMGLVGCSTDGANGSAESMVGELAPDFTVTDADGNAFRLSDQLGTPVFVDFSAMWCSTCRNQAPVTEALFEERGDVAVVWTVLFQDAEGDPPDAAALTAWSDEYDLLHPVLADDAEESAYMAFGSGRQPLGVVIDAEGRITWTAEGGSVATGCAQALDDVLP